MDFPIHNDTIRFELSFSYCNSRNARDNFIFANNVKMHICDVKHLLVEHE